ncbi:hypothetical protein FRC07_004980 [Ceratobasidium sp. 392]|nr:hypothetical protein FRC07_004980 [Ceratobasidium sp. 392]
MALRKFPQHNPDLPPPAGRNGRYIRFRNQLYGHGWGNILQEILLDTHLAHESGRSYVFVPFHASAHPAMGLGLVAPWIPLNAFIDAPTAGGSWPAGDKTSRAVTEDWYNTVCPKNQRVTLDTEAVAGHLKDSDAQNLIDFWSRKLREMEDSLIGSTRVLTAFKEFSTSATVKMFKWSKLVLGTVERNAELISPADQRSSLNYVLPTEGQLDGLLAIHVRRGDYSRHCTRLAKWSSTYVSWALLPQLPDAFKVPEGAGQGHATDKALAEYYRVCWPSNKQIVERARAMRQQHKRLDRVYILTNGNAWYIARLKADLKADHWAKVSTSQDMRLNWQETWVSQSVDMAIAQRAEVFVGNGVGASFVTAATVTYYTTVLNLFGQHRSTKAY